MEQTEIVNYLQRISQSNKSLDFVNQLENELESNGKSHISLECQIAFMLWDNGEESLAVEKFKKIIENEIEESFPNYGTVFADSVGMSISFLIEKKFKRTNIDLKDLFRMGYVYLTKHIEMYGETMCDSFKYRAYLTENCQNQTQSLAFEFLKVLSFIPIPVSISDYYSAGKAYYQLGYNEKYRECIERGAYLHQWLEDIMINGKDADEYEFTEMAEIGKKRLDSLNSKIEDFKIFESKKVFAALNEI